MRKLIHGVVASMLVLLQTAAVSASDSWDAFERAASERHGAQGREAAAFLRAHRPERDVDLDADLLITNLDLAFQARTEFPWASGVPWELFLNDVLPYAVLDETRENWRPAMLDRARAIVKDCTSATEAAQALNRELFNVINVHYNTGRKKPNQSPAESIAQGRATCTGLTIILVDACRAVGIPARAAGVAAWNQKNGNHTWAEVWDGQWYFTGADEYNAQGLNRAWFVGDARRALVGHPVHAVRASSWSHDDGHFPMAWSPRDRSVGGVDVTFRYVAPSGESESGATRHLRVWNRKGGERLEATVRVLDPEGATVMAVETRAGRRDLNDMPSVHLVPGVPYQLEVIHGGGVKSATITAAEAGTETVDLYLDQLGLSRDAAETRLRELAALRAMSIDNGQGATFRRGTIEASGQTLKLLEKKFGDAPAGSRSLWISMHGGGGAPPRVNDQQWRNQIRLYEPDEGFYVAPRAPTDTWNLWHQGHIDDLFDRLIETYVATRGVDPNRVYLMGYSAGGDGVYQLAPRMADRFAAASMMAGHPNEAQPWGLRNLPFAIFMGGKDGAYDRNKVAERWGARLGELQAEDPDGYPHWVTIYPDFGHWMNGEDKEALPWMSEQTRDPWPSRIVWFQDDRVHTRFYWLSVDASEAQKGRMIRAAVDGQTIAIEMEHSGSVTLRLRDGLVDLDAPLRVTMNGDVVFEGLVARDELAIMDSLAERFDPASACFATLRVSTPE